MHEAEVDETTAWRKKKLVRCRLGATVGKFVFFSVRQPASVAQNIGGVRRFRPLWDKWAGCSFDLYGDMQGTGDHECSQCVFAVLLLQHCHRMSRPASCRTLLAYVATVKKQLNSCFAHLAIKFSIARREVGIYRGRTSCFGSCLTRQTMRPSAWPGEIEQSICKIRLGTPADTTHAQPMQSMHILYGVQSGGRQG